VELFGTSIPEPNDKDGEYSPSGAKCSHSVICARDWVLSRAIFHQVFGQKSFAVFNATPTHKSSQLCSDFLAGGRSLSGRAGGKMAENF
jgi:hypothetical protein